MPLTTDEEAKRVFLSTVNSGAFDPVTNPNTLADPYYIENYPLATQATAIVSNAVARLADEAADDAATASAAAVTAEGFRDATEVIKDEAMVAKNAAEAAAASATFPFGVTTGTSTAYLLDFDPDQVTAVGSAFRVHFHISNGATPTLSVDGGAAVEIVNQAGQSLDAGDIAANRIYMVIYDAALSKWAINTFPANEFIRNNETATLATGYATTSHDLGTITTGTVTPDEVDGQFQYYVNGGAHTLAPPANDTVITVQITNNGSAGAITTSGFTRTTGDTFTTTNGHDFIADMRRINGFTQLHVTALQ